MARKRTDVVLFVEHVARDLDVATAVKYLADRQHGVAVEIASIVMHRQSVLAKYEPRVVALPYGISASAYGMSDILRAWPDSAYVSLSCEQIFRKHQLAVKAPQDSFAREHLLHHAWGDFYASYLKQRGVPEDNIFVNGNPTYALYKAPYVAYFESRNGLGDRFGLDPGKRWIFVPENYGAAFGSDRAVRRPVEGGLGEAEEVHKFAVDSLREVARWWSLAAEANTAEVIIRPRPATPREDLRQACQEFVGRLPESLHFIKDGTVREWILASDVVASSYSTTLIEAAVASKPIWMLAPTPFPESMHTEWHQLVPKVDSLSGFLDLVNSREPVANWQPLQAWAEREMLSHGEPITQLADFLAKVARGERPVADRPIVSNSEPDLWRLSMAAELVHRWRRRARNYLRNALLKARRRRTPFQEIYEQDDFDERDVARRVSRWAQTLRLGSEVR